MINGKYIITQDELLEVINGKDIREELDLFIEASQALDINYNVYLRTGLIPKKILPWVIGESIKNCLFRNGACINLMNCYKQSWGFSGNESERAKEKSFYLDFLDDNNISKERWGEMLEAYSDYDRSSAYADIYNFYDFIDCPNRCFEYVSYKMETDTYECLLPIFELITNKMTEFTYKDIFEEDDFVKNIDKYKEFLVDKLNPICEVAISDLKDEYRQSEDYARRIAMGLEVEKELNDLFELINVYKDIILIDGNWTIKHNADAYKLLLPEEVFDSLVIKCEVEKKEREL